ncbi:MAG: protein kinase, partial [Chloroflexi bacterium]|nr:protein kinase [Chloroflexota bacterium]
MSDVFISYVEEDTDIVEPIARGLTEAGYSCWHYTKDSIPGTSYLAQITAAIARAQVVLLVLSERTLDSFQVDKEISFAHESNKPFLPIVRDLAWSDFQRRQPTWRLAIGTTVAIPVPPGGVETIVPRVLEGLRRLRVQPGESENGAASRSVPELASRIGMVLAETDQSGERVSFQGGRYRVVRRLGEGGKGIAYLCHDTALGREVAVKVLKEDGLDVDGHARFQREIQSMARLAHPNVVTVYDVVQEGRRSFLVLEYLEGGDLDAAIAARPQRRLDVATVLGVGRDVARALEYLHGHGVIHRDVKPGNVWLTAALDAGAGAQAKLGDFGLALLGDGTRLTRVGMLVGSVAYLPPDVALGRPADHRSDLYMLGATLYEMATGRVPFPGDDPVRVIFQHVNDLPVPPRRFAPELPEPLEHLILRLLAKDPAQRPATAGDVARVLDEIGRSGGESVAASGPAAPEARAVRASTPEPRFAQPLIGRDRELALLRARVDAAARGEGGLVLVTGEAGIGKTRLALEVRAHARSLGCLWLEGRYPKEIRIPGQGWVEAIRGLLRTAAPATISRVVRDQCAPLLKFVPELADWIGPLPPPPPVSPEEERARLVEAFAGLFLAISREQPLVLFGDDLQWATSLDLLPALARRVESERLLLIAAYRDAELKEQPGLAKTLLTTQRERTVHNVTLRRLNEDEVAQLVAATLGEAASDKLARAVYQKTEGNPFFVGELVRYLTESGAVTLGDHGWEVPDAGLLQLPDSIKAVVGERLERLGDEAKRALTWAAVVGREFALAVLEDVADLDEDVLLEAMDRAVAARVLAPRPGLGQEVYAFVDNQMRDVLYDGIGPARRRRYHRKVAEAIERVHLRRLEEQYDALAHHFLEGNDLEKALEYALKAGERAYQAPSWAQARGHFETALELMDELPEDLERRAQVLERLADLDNVAGHQSTLHAEQALEAFTKLGDKRKAARMARLVGRAWNAGFAGVVDWPRVMEYMETGARLLADEPDSVEKASCLGGLTGALALGRLELDRALATGEAAVAVAERLGNVDEEAITCAHLGAVLVLRGDLDRAREYAERSWETAQRGHDLFSKAQVMYYPLWNWPWRHDRDDLTRWLERAVDYRSRYRVERYDRPIYGVKALLSALLGQPAAA